MYFQQNNISLHKSLFEYKVSSMIKSITQDRLYKIYSMIQKSLILSKWKGIHLERTCAYQRVRNNSFSETFVHKTK